MIVSSEESSADRFTCLAIETAAGAVSVAACTRGRTSSRENSTQSLRSRDIFADVRTVLEELGLRIDDLSCVAFGCGPGAFTGLRVAAAAAQALAYGAGIPVVPVSSLAALAAGAARKHGAECIAACLDARMGEAYLAVYRCAQPGDMHVDVFDRLVDPENFRLSPELSVFAAGPGWSAYPHLVDNHQAQISGADFALEPSAIDVIAIAAREFAAGHAVDAAQAVPNYVRDKVTY